MGFYDILLAKQLAGSGGGGGGSSDFSTATVTITNNTNDPIGFYAPLKMDIEGFGSFAIGETSVDMGVTLQLQTIMYKGLSVASVSSGTVTATGAVEDMGGVYFISGDATFTIS